MDHQPADRPLGVLDLEDDLAAEAQDAPIADLATALGIEGRPVEDDLGGGTGPGRSSAASTEASTSYSRSSRTIPTTSLSSTIVVS